MQKRIITWKRAFICLAAINLIGFAWLVVSPLFFMVLCAPEPERVEIADFVGLQIDEVSEMENRNFFGKYDFIVVYEETEAPPAGSIIRQSPAAGRSVAINNDGVVPVTLYVAMP